MQQHTRAQTSSVPLSGAYWENTMMKVTKVTQLKSREILK